MQRHLLAIVTTLEFQSTRIAPSHVFVLRFCMSTRQYIKSIEGATFNNKAWQPKKLFSSNFCFIPNLCKRTDFLNNKQFPSEL